jgi:hypothetical protein
VRSPSVRRGTPKATERHGNPLTVRFSPRFIAPFPDGGAPGASANGRTAHNPAARKLEARLSPPASPHQSGAECGPPFTDTALWRNLRRGLCGLVAGSESIRLQPRRAVGGRAGRPRAWPQWASPQWSRPPAECYRSNERLAVLACAGVLIAGVRYRLLLEDRAAGRPVDLRGRRAELVRRHDRGSQAATFVRASDRAPAARRRFSDGRRNRS